MPKGWQTLTSLNIDDISSSSPEIAAYIDSIGQGGKSGRELMKEWMKSMTFMVINLQSGFSPNISVIVAPGTELPTRAALEREQAAVKATMTAYDKTMSPIGDVVITDATLNGNPVGPVMNRQLYFGPIEGKVIIVTCTESDAAKSKSLCDTVRGSATRK